MILVTFAPGARFTIRIRESPTFTLAFGVPMFIVLAKVKPQPLFADVGSVAILMVPPAEGVAVAVGVAVGVIVAPPVGVGVAVRVAVAVAVPQGPAQTP